ncbi:3079_t:CDS:2 [Paraglomus occultum]|uniref:3079_t:CDS:1 n=1 Tax=Paraglomus occultum TaxID=144539 RepID=A0A9N9GJE0_9GLOM|nr:3079_t:CDS:2 [Paraglomus occultum]
MEFTSSADLKEVARELAKHLDVSETGSQIVKEINSNIAIASSQMEDMKVSLEQIRSESAKQSESAKELFEAAHHLDALYNKIDNLEAFMNVVKKTVNDVTDRVDEAERFLTSPINRVWESLKLNTARSVEPSEIDLPPMKPLEIYNTADYFLEENK